MRATEDDINVFSGEDFFMVLFFSEEDERLSTYNRMGQSTENESSSHSLNARRTWPYLEKWRQPCIKCLHTLRTMQSLETFERGVRLEHFHIRKCERGGLFDLFSNESYRQSTKKWQHYLKDILSHNTTLFHCGCFASLCSYCASFLVIFLNVVVKFVLVVVKCLFVVVLCLFAVVLRLLIVVLHLFVVV